MAETHESCGFSSKIINFNVQCPESSVNFAMLVNCLLASSLIGLISGTVLVFLVDVLPTGEDRARRRIFPRKKNHSAETQTETMHNADNAANVASEGEFFFTFLFIYNHTFISSLGECMPHFKY